MKFLIINSFLHHKNKIGIEMILDNLNYDYKYGGIEDIPNYDIIYLPAHPIDTSIYPNKKFIFGPHFSVFPDNKLLKINNNNNNSVYIQPSEWVVDLWKKANEYLPVKQLPFPVDVDKFSINENKNINKVFVYFKSRHPSELNYVLEFLKSMNIEYKVFDYKKRYDESEYLNYLQECKYGIVVDAHESQGFAIEEALSCNVPLLVWGVQYMSQEYGGNYLNIPCTTIAYWNNQCGEVFYNSNELEVTFNTFINKIEEYEPRKYILENLSLEKCRDNFIKIIDEIVI